MAFEKNMNMNSDLLNLDVGSIFVPQTIVDILVEVSTTRDFSEKLSKYDFHVNSLEEEMRKIGAFKRELPHCMHLLKDAIETLKKEKMKLKEREKVPLIMDELLPQKSDADEDRRAKLPNDISEKKNWMSCVQLWNTHVQYENNFDIKYQSSILPKKSGFAKEEDDDDDEEKRRSYECNFNKQRGEFVPFKRTLIIKEENRDGEGLSLSILVSEVQLIDLNVKDTCDFIRQQRDLHKKQRRCWSPELHKRFIDALLHLGGAETATPKNIRELMDVDGLTNDEVKSHLQKYRLHIKKIPKSFGDDEDEMSGSTEDHLHGKCT